MANYIIQDIQSFRQELISNFSYNKAALLGLIDAMAGQRRGESAVKMSLSPLFLRHYTSISHAVSDLFREKLFHQKRTKGKISEKERKNGNSQLLHVLAKHFPQPSQPTKQCFILLGTDCTSNERMFAECLEDRTMVHVSNKVAGAPVTIGHQYSVIVGLPERKEKQSSSWVYPLSTVRVKSTEVGPSVGAEQLRSILKEEVFRGRLCVNVADAAYSTASYIKAAQENGMKDVVQVLRLRGNRVLHKQLLEIKRPEKRGRPSRYGEKLRLQDPFPADAKEVFERKTKRGQKIEVTLERWKNLLVRGKEQCDAIDVVRVTVRNEQGLLKYPKPLCLAIVGQRRSELSLEQAYEAYTQRYDVEHFFRFSKKNLLINKFQTPDVEHEENWWWLGTMAYVMLYLARPLSNSLLYPWEKKGEKLRSGMENSPSGVQRDYERIIWQIGAKVEIPKPREKSPGREKGQTVRSRTKQTVIIKSKKSKKVV